MSLLLVAIARSWLAWLLILVVIFLLGFVRVSPVAEESAS